mgnify:FL=1
MAEHIMVVDDEAAIADLVEVYLRNEGYAVHKFYCAADALACAESTSLDMAILDVMLPDMDGFTLCQALRKTHLWPIIMLTAKVEDMDKIMGLTLGADDYITKPFSVRELMARVKAHIRRVALIRQSAGNQEDRLDFGRLVIHKESAQATKDGERLELTQREFELLTYLASHAGRVFSRQELMERVWNYEGYVGDVRGVDVAVRRLREKLEDDPAQPKYIITRRGAGYYFQKDL